MLAFATTRASVWRDTDTTDTDAYGDGVETGGTPHLTGVPMSIIEQEKRLFGQPTPQGGEPGEESGDMRIIKFVVARAGFGTDVQIGDRIQDEADGTFYSVTDVVLPKNAVIAMDVRMNLRRLA